MTGFDALWAFERYEEVRPRLPSARAEGAALLVEGLGALAQRYDGFVLDAFGVINVGETAIAGAADSIAGLQALGKTVLVVTNGATTPGEATAAKYAKMDLPLTRREVISSRDALALALAEEKGIGLWGFAATEASELEQFGTPFSLLGEDPEDYRRAEGFVLLSSIDWNDERQALLAAALAERPRPLLVGNPDLVAPREWGFSAEPGHYAHLLADAGLAAPSFYGKPYPEVFELAAAELARRGVAGDRVCMVGDTLHTDILGGAAQGWGTVLVTGHGLYRGLDVAALIERSGLSPDFVTDSI